jgi:hypothetical protein
MYTTRVASLLPIGATFHMSDREQRGMRASAVILSAVFAVLAASVCLYHFWAKIPPSDAQGAIGLLAGAVLSLFVAIGAYLWFHSLACILMDVWTKDSPMVTAKRSVGRGVRITIFVALSFIGVFAVGSYIKHESLLRAAAASAVWERQMTIYENAVDPYDHEVMMRLAENPNASPMLLSLLAKDQHISVRARVAMNARVTAEVDEALASDPDAHVRGALAHNPSTPNSTIQKLRSDSDPYVRGKADLFAGRRGLQ